MRMYYLQEHKNMTNYLASGLYKYIHIKMASEEHRKGNNHDKT